MVDNYATKKVSIKAYIIFILLVALAVAVGFVFLSPTFEQNKPQVNLKSAKFWNLKDNIKVNISDDSGIKYYKITFQDGKREVVLKKEVLAEPQKELSLDIEPPKRDLFFKGDKVSITVDAVDSSRWNFFEGNSIKAKYDIDIDMRRPIASVVANTRAIRKGGSAVVVVKVKDENLKKAYIDFNNEVQFKLIPFYKKDYYAAIIAWPVTIDEFKRVNLVAIDHANNITKSKVPLFIRDLRVKNDHIKISDSFIESVSTTVLEQSKEQIPNELVERFKLSNQYLRKKNVNTIRKLVLENMNYEKVDSYNLKEFKRLRGAKKFAGFGERRHYHYHGEEVDQAWHLGMDWASVKKATVRAQESGRVIFDDYLGIYGNTIIIDHKFGLATLYAHVSSSDIQMGAEVRRGQKVANTGSTGAVFGDHLHFGVLVQGIEVNPVEWMDKNWIKTRITDIIKKSKKIIDGQS
jgi:murein DD-endopeptidase MepM/ murein hydrolase activator NlpD